MNAILIKGAAVANQIGVLISAMPTEKKDAILDIIEDSIEKSETKLDDRFLLPLVQAVRVVLDIPDNDVVPTADPEAQA